MPLAIRDCAKSDIREIVAIEQASFEDPYPQSLFISFLKNFPQGFRVAEIAGTLAGYCIILPSNDARVMIVTSLAIHPDFKRRKIASSLLQDAISIATAIGRVNVLLLQVADENVAAQNLYSKFGFVATRHLDDYYRPGKHGKEMKLLLK